jgi:glyoxylate reductase
VKRPLVLLTHPFLPDVIRAELEPHARVRVARTRAEQLRQVAAADALICDFSFPVGEALLARAPRLKAVGNVAVGVNNIDLAACARRRVGVVNTPGVLTRATAELTLTLCLAAARRVPEGERLCRSGGFQGWEADQLLGLELRGRHAVLVGRGRIGRETERLFRGVGLTTEWITRADGPAAILRKLQRAQVLSLHVPLTPETRHWLDARRLAALPRDAIVLNTTRGPVVDEAALIRALRARRIFAAGLDVYEREPEIPAALRRLPNVVLLPHVGSATRTAREAMTRLAVRGVLQCLRNWRPGRGVLRGQRPPNWVGLPT